MMMAPPNAMRPVAGGGAPPGGARPGAGASSHYSQIQGAAGEPDQPLAQRFTMLSLANPPGTQSGQPVPDPEQIPRPTPEDLAAPLREEVRNGIEDYGVVSNANFVRMTVSQMPNSTATKAKAALPLGAVIQPLAHTDEPVPVVEPGDCGVVRCRRCRTYVNAFVRFIDSGRRWKCNVCGLSNDVPSDYYCLLTHLLTYLL